MSWRPKKLYIYIIKRFIPLLLAGFSVSLFVVVIQFLWQSIGTLVGKGVDGLILLQLLFFASMTMVPLALVLGVLVASLMAFGNLGERMELLAMKAAGIPLLTILKPVFLFVVALAVGLFVFQNDWMIQSQVKFWQYYFSIKNKAPELAIPEGSFYKGVDNYSIFVERKDTKRKMLYGIMVYDYTNGFDQSMVVVADSGRLYSTTAGMELILELYGGESFQNLRGEGSYYQSSADRPFIRERFGYKELHIPFNTDLSMMDESILSSQFVGKNIVELKQYTDSLRLEIDSVARVGVESSANKIGYQRVARQVAESRNMRVELAKADHLRGTSEQYEPEVGQSGRLSEELSTVRRNVEEAFQTSGQSISHSAMPDGFDPHQEPEKESVKEPVKEPQRRAEVGKQAPLDIRHEMIPMGAGKQSNVYGLAISSLAVLESDNFFMVEEQRENVDLLRKNESEFWRKITYPVACIAFFLIGAPLGALIRKGGMGVPFLVAVSLFIVFYILETFGFKMSREGVIVTWVGMWLPNMVLIPVGLLLCWAASRDTNRLSFAFLAPLGKLFKRSTGRQVEYKEVTMESVVYAQVARDLQVLDEMVSGQLGEARLGYVAFFSDSSYFEARKEISQRLERLVGLLQHSRDYALEDHFNGYPILSTKEWRSSKKRVNSLLMWFVPVGFICYLRYKLRNKRYTRGLQTIREYNRLLREDIERVGRE